MKLFYVSIILFFISMQTSMAATDDFVISQQVGFDVTSPTSPQNVSATSTSDSQVDVSWDVSTDDFAVGGYQVFRDAVQIATTTVNLFSDTGLTASTSYAYNIRAFDTSFNFSTTSATATAVTRDLVIAPTTTPEAAVGGGGGLRRTDVFVSDVVIETATTTAAISFDTRRLGRTAVAWGRSIDYELGYSLGAVLTTDHHVVITNLDPGTLYELRIVVTDQFGRESLMTRSFRTQVGADTIAPANPMGFTAVEVDGIVQLEWQNPDDLDFAYVRVVSNDQFYPTDQYAGYLVYEGGRSAVDDARVVVRPARYYSIFAYDRSGNVSSGAVTSVRLIPDDQGVVPVPGGVVPDRPETPLPSDSPPEAISLDFTDIQFSSNSASLERDDTTVYISTETVSTISIPYEALPERLKTIVVRLAHPENPNKEFAFMLRVNANKTAYEARVGALTEPGVYALTGEVFDYKTQTITTLEGSVTVVPAATKATNALYHNRQVQLLGFFVVLWFLLFVFRRFVMSPEDSGV